MYTISNLSRRNSVSILMAVRTAEIRDGKSCSKFLVHASAMVNFQDYFITHILMKMSCPLVNIPVDQASLRNMLCNP